MRKWLGLATLALLLAGGAACWMGDLDPDVNLSSASEVWADVLRDADQLGLRFTRMSDAREMDLGNRLAEGLNTAGPADRAQSTYVAAVGAALVPYLRRPAIRYNFHVLQSPEENAFALPGGQVFIFTGLLADIHSEAELAYILGHEMSHVDLRHAVEIYQNEAALERAGAPPLARIPEDVRRLVARGYSKFQEVEADAQGLRLCSQAGYDPEAGARLYRRFRPGSPRTASANPLDEAAGAARDQLTSYFDTHPPDAERIRRLEELARRDRRRLAGRPLYEGLENYQRQVPKSVQQFPDEFGKG
ncbi:MAG TPA: M48 family metallopeptidase [Bryobacteraceae bacterium]|nr:M48 family metallopeptidase [Bryobacteraceae bacterium]